MAAVYVLTNKSMPGICKVGYTLRSLNARLSELNASTSIPTRFSAEYFVEIDEAYAHKVEKRAHAALERKGFHHGKEYFNCSVDDCKEAIAEAIAGLGIVVLYAEDAEQTRKRIAQIEAKRKVDQAREAERAERERLQSEKEREIRTRYAALLESKSDPGNFWIWWIAVGLGSCTLLAVNFPKMKDSGVFFGGAFLGLLASSLGRGWIRSRREQTSTYRALVTRRDAEIAQLRGFLPPQPPQTNSQQPNGGSVQSVGWWPPTFGKVVVFACAGLIAMWLWGEATKSGTRAVPSPAAIHGNWQSTVPKVASTSTSTVVPTPSKKSELFLPKRAAGSDAPRPLTSSGPMEPQGKEVTAAELGKAEVAKPPPHTGTPPSQTSALQLSELNRDEKQSIESACSTDKYRNGPAAYNRCLSNQLALLAKGERAPNLSGLNRDEKYSIESACSTDKYRNGPAAYNRCLSSQFALLANGERAPNLSGLNRDEKYSIESACSKDKYRNGPAAYNRCLSNQLALLAKADRTPDLSRLTKDEKFSIESACSRDKYRNGPAAYNRCLSNQLGELARTSTR